MERGAIRDKMGASILCDFTGLKYGKITPTDLDGFVDFGNKIFVLIECKGGKARMPYGQRLALERLIDNSKVKSLLIVAKWKKLSKGFIDVANCEVTQIRFEEKWHKIPKTTVRKIVDRFVEKYAPEYNH